MSNSASLSPSADEVVAHFRHHIATVLPPAGLHVKAVTDLEHSDRTLTVHIDPARAGAQTWAFNDVFKPMGLAEIYGTAIGFNDEAGTRMRTVVDKIVVLDRNGVVYDSINMDTVHRKCVASE